jgi:hypothetical protein
MNNQEKYNEDRLKQYINHETIEKAPDEFTSKVMARIRTEVVTEKEAGRLRNRNLVPVISAGITIILLVAAFLITGNKADSSTLQVTDLIKNLKVTLPDINLTALFSQNVKGLLMYVFTGILILTLFDRALYGVFHRKKEG